MSRIREFDPDKTLHRALELFWRKGYAETSMRDLVDYTGVAHAGLYSVFGSKRQLFRTALEHYRDGKMTRFLRNLETPVASKAEIIGFFNLILHIIKDGDFINGCFMVNTAIEFGDESGDIVRLVKEHMNRLLTAFQLALERAKDAGEVRADLDALATAEYLVNTFNGMAVHARAQMPYDRLVRVVKIALKELE